MQRAFLLFIIVFGGSILFTLQSSDKKTFEQDAFLPSPAPSITLSPKELLGVATSSETNLLPPPSPPPPPTLVSLPPPPIAPPPPKPILQAELYQKGLGATVNFLCINQNNTYTVATGAIIDPRGYIISNAHIINKNNLTPTCTVRAGSPAKNIGEVKLVFMPSTYHAATDEEAQARLDISLWKMVGTRTDWPSWTLDFDTKAVVDEELLTQSYPAELLSNEVILKDLALVFSTTIVAQIDSSVIVSRATLSAQHGSSGGILIDPYTGKLRGIIFGISAEATQAINERLLYAIAPSRINAIVWQETQKQFGEYLAALPKPIY